MSHRFLEALAKGTILLDGGMGTRLIARGLGRGEASAWNLERPNDIFEIHRLDIEAGSDAVLTNTFCAGRNWLERFGLGEKTSEINRRGVELARLAVGPERLVLGSIGPTAQGQEKPLIEQAEALVGAGVNALVLETHTAGQAEAATRTLVGRFLIPVIASLYAWPEPMGDIARKLTDAGASVIGVNCSLTMAESLEVARKLHRICPLPLMVKPGIVLNGSTPPSIEPFADPLPDLIANGVKLLGGCCGTTEVHIAALRAGLKSSSLVDGHKGLQKS